MPWPDAGILVVAMMSAVPPMIAVIRWNVLAFAGSLIASILAVWLATNTFFVPISIILLIVSFALAVRRWKPEQQRTAYWVRMALLIAPVLAIGFYAVMLSIKYNRSTPSVLEQSLASPLTDRDQAITEELNSRFPKGTDEAVLKAALLEQGFRNTEQPRPRCRLPNLSMRSYGSCPDGAREMKYDLERFNLVCGTTHISVNWSADRGGRITRLEATSMTYCL